MGQHLQMGTGEVFKSSSDLKRQQVLIKELEKSHYALWSTTESIYATEEQGH